MSLESRCFVSEVSETPIKLKKPSVTVGTRLNSSDCVNTSPWCQLRVPFMCYRDDYTALPHRRRPYPCSARRHNVAREKARLFGD